MTDEQNITATITLPLRSLRSLQGAAGSWATELEHRIRRTDDHRLQGLLRMQADRIRSASAAAETALESADFNEEAPANCTCAPEAGPHPGCAEFADDRDLPCPACQAAYEEERDEEAYVVTFSTPEGRILAEHEGALPDVSAFRDGFQSGALAGPRTDVRVNIDLATLETVTARRNLHYAVCTFDRAQRAADVAFRDLLHDPSSARRGRATRTARELEEATAAWDLRADELARCDPQFDTVLARAALLQ